MRCEGCKQKRETVKLRQKLNPANLHEIRSRLCTPCARAGGWRDVDFNRGRGSTPNTNVTLRD